jgi:hypothetical protein
MVPGNFLLLKRTHPPALVDRHAPTRALQRPRLPSDGGRRRHRPVLNSQDSPSLSRNEQGISCQILVNIYSEPSLLAKLPQSHPIIFRSFTLTLRNFRSTCSISPSKHPGFYHLTPRHNVPWGSAALRKHVANRHRCCSLKPALLELATQLSQETIEKLRKNQ